MKAKLIYQICQILLAGKEDFEYEIFSIHFHQPEGIEGEFRIYIDTGAVVDVSHQIDEEEGETYTFYSWHDYSDDYTPVSADELIKLLS